MNELRRNQAARKRTAKKAAVAKRAVPPPRNPLPPPAPTPKEPESAKESDATSGDASDKSSHEISHEVDRETGGPQGPQPPTTDEGQDGAKDGGPREISHEIGHETSRDVSGKAPRPTAEAVTPPVVDGMPDLQVGEDPAARVVSPTQLSVRGSIMRRFDAERKQRPGATHTSLMLDAVRATAPRLPTLVLVSRPTARAGDLFPWRPSPEETPTDDRPEPLRIRPLIGELTVIDDLVTWVNDHVQRQQPRSPKVTRSELVSVALDESLPKPAKKTKKN